MRNLPKIALVKSICVAVVALANILPAAAQNDPAILARLRKPTATRDGGDHTLGYVPPMGSPPTPAATLQFARTKRGARPASLQLTEYLPPIGSQGLQGSCVTWALCYYSYSYKVARQRQLDPALRSDKKFLFSPAYLYNQIHLPHGGTNFETAFRVLDRQGCATLAQMDYDPRDDQTQPSPDATQRAQRFRPRAIAQLFRGKVVGGYGPNLENLKTLLAETQEPFVISITVFTDFPQHQTIAPEYVYKLTVPPIPINVKGGHALTVIGYDDARQAFLVANSWGPQWGQNGLLWISEEFLQRWTIDGWAFLAGGAVAREGRAAQTWPGAPDIQFAPTPVRSPRTRGSGGAL